MILFCDHILHETKSFKDRPEPKIYELILYFNDFIDKYIPSALNLDFMAPLKEHFMFSEYRKNLGELFLWLSSWISMQQYYQNKYFR
jgi:hypothetical protein